ncbi:Proline-rich protein 5-like [Halotydeus destructor]|nr:Proline-rich protein 5-like [Halotydeus destructor]
MNRSLSVLLTPEFNSFLENESQTLGLQSSRKKWHSLERGMLGLFEKTNIPLLEPGQLKQMHENVRKVLDSKLGPFLYDSYKTKILPQGMERLRTRLGSNDEKNLLSVLVQIWRFYFTEIMPTLDAILYRVKCKGNLNIRQTSLVCFRDELLFKTDFQEHIDVLNHSVDIVHQQPLVLQLRHMTLTLLTVMDSWPPSGMRLALERVAASLVTPFLGYDGLYVDFNAKQPWHTSNEPKVHEVRKLGEGKFPLFSPLSVSLHVCAQFRTFLQHRTLGATLLAPSHGATKATGHFE